MPWSQKFLGEAVRFRDGAVLVAVAAELSYRKPGAGQTFEVLLRAGHSGDAIIEAKHRLLQTPKVEGLI
jgi:hypothetical protein